MVSIETKRFIRRIESILKMKSEIDKESLYFTPKYVGLSLAALYQLAKSKNYIHNPHPSLNSELVEAIQGFREGRKATFPNKKNTETLDQFFNKENIHFVAGYLESTAGILWRQEYTTVVGSISLLKKNIKSSRESKAYQKAKNIWKSYLKHKPNY